MRWLYILEFKSMEQGSEDHTMTCDVEQITKNLRYKILNIKGDFYILDMDRNGWVFLFPFLYWLLPHYLFKINQATVEKIEIQNPTREGTLNAFGVGGIVIILGNLMQPLINYLEIETTIMVNIIILLILLIPVIFIRFMISSMNRKKLLQIVHLSELQTEKVRIKPESIQYMMKHLFFNLVFLALAIVGGYAFLTYGNIFMLFGGLLFLFIILMINSQAVQAGKAKIKFIQ